MFGDIADMVAERLGFKVIRQALFRELQGTLGWDNLAELPIRPGTVIDVGVADGTPELYAAFPDAHLVLVEPVEEFFAGIGALLSTRAGVHLPIALGEREDSLEMNVQLTDGAKSSFLTRTALSATGEVPARRSVAVRPLDAAVAEMALVSPVLLKIDVEGFELPVLRGATATLRRTDVVIIESSVAKRFEGAAGFEEVVGFMFAQGFRLRDIVRVSRHPGGGVRHMDLVFQRAT